MIPTSHEHEDSNEEWYNRLIYAYMFRIDHDLHLRECGNCYQNVTDDLGDAFMMYQIISGLINERPDKFLINEDGKVSPRQPMNDPFIEEEWVKSWRESWQKLQ